MRGSAEEARLTFQTVLLALEYLLPTTPFLHLLLRGNQTKVQGVYAILKSRVKLTIDR